MLGKNKKTPADTTLALLKLSAEWTWQEKIKTPSSNAELTTEKTMKHIRHCNQTKITMLMALFLSVLRFSFQHDTFIVPTSKTSL